MTNINLPADMTESGIETETMSVTNHPANVARAHLMTVSLVRNTARVVTGAMH